MDKPEEWRIWGPPGTGKTTTIADLASKAAEIYGEDQVSICSLTNSAVNEASTRDIPISLDNLTTLHARCKRSLSAPPPAEAYMDEFREAYPQFATEDHIPPRVGKDIHSSEDRILSSGFTVYDTAQILRQRMIPIKEWTPRIQTWYRVWSQWCMETDRMDFAGWLEMALISKSLPAQQVVFVDEAQDHTPLQLEVLRSWKAKHLFLVGDDDQSLYEWSGATPDRFFLPNIGKRHERVLKHSYRLPENIHKFALKQLTRISSRKDKVYLPSRPGGVVEGSPLILEDTNNTTISGLLDGRKHMILTSCAHMLNHIIRRLKDEGILFHNPYRRSNSIWNPLSSSTAIGVKSYIMDEWTGRNVIKWIPLLKDEAFKSKAGLEKLCDDQMDVVIDPQEIAVFLSDLAVAGVLTRTHDNLIKWSHGTTEIWQYYRRIFKRGADIDPRVVVGTIHSVKGGEADVVHIFPDISAAAAQSYDDAPDQIHRLFYVAITRARDTLIIHEPSSSKAYNI